MKWRTARVAALRAAVLLALTALAALAVDACLLLGEVARGVLGLVSVLFGS